MATQDELTVRSITEAEGPAYIAAARRGFLQSGTLSESDANTVVERFQLDPARTFAAFDGDRIVGTLRSIPREMTVPGGATVPASGVTGVTVTSTHRRRGLLTRMMRRDLDTAVERGEPVAVLDAAEYPIYGRYGFGPAAGIAQWTVDVVRALLPPAPPADGSRIDLATPAEVREVGPGLFDRVRLLHPGTNARTYGWWRTFTGELQYAADPWTEPFYAVYRDPSGRVDGLITYHIKHGDRPDLIPGSVLTVVKADFATPQAEAALWRYVLSVDWVRTVHSGYRALDDALPLLLGNRRAAHLTTHSDWLWLRVLDAPAALTARAYNTTGTLVLRIDDPDGYAHGTFRLDAATTPGASTVTPAAPEDAELAMNVGELGSLYLGGESAVRLASVGHVTELRPGAAAQADLLLRTSRVPWCPDTF